MPQKVAGRSVKRKASRKASTYALFTKKAYAGKVKGLKLKSLKNLSKEARKKAFSANAKAISKAYSKSKKKSVKRKSPKRKASRKRKSAKKKKKSVKKKASRKRKSAKKKKKSVKKKASRKRKSAKRCPSGCVKRQSAKRKKNKFRVTATTCKYGRDPVSGKCRKKYGGNEGDASLSHRDY